MRSKGSKHGQWTQSRVDAQREHCSDNCRCAHEEVAGLVVAAVPSTVFQRPELAGELGVLSLAAKQPRANPEQQPSPKFESIRLAVVPGEWLH